MRGMQPSETTNRSSCLQPPTTLSSGKKIADFTFTQKCFSLGLGKIDRQIFCISWALTLSSPDAQLLTLVLEMCPEWSRFATSAFHTGPSNEIFWPPSSVLAQVTPQNGFQIDALGFVHWDFLYPWEGSYMECFSWRNRNMSQQIYV